MHQPQSSETPFDVLVEQAAKAMADAILHELEARPVPILLGALAWALLAPAQFFSAANYF